MSFQPSDRTLATSVRRDLRLHAICLVGLLAFANIGCTALRLPAVLPFGQEQDSQYISGDGSPLHASEGEMMYKKVREAKSQNAIVLQIAGAEPPIRVLPLPPEGQTVFVSDLLNQTGVLEEFGRIDATLYRDAPGMPAGVRMAVKMNRDHDQVRPESDYSLRSGDRLSVQKAKSPAMNGLLSGLLGI
jgi:hypothetical protein